MVESQPAKLDPSFMGELKRLGAFDISACFSCGNCTAICPLSSGATSFPRKLISYAQLGLERKIIETPDMWLCDYCGECSRTCPRQAEPSEFMMALRRFAVSRYSPTPLSRKLFTSKPFFAAFLIVTALIPLGLMATFHGPLDPPSATMFTFLPEYWIHYAGIALGAAIAVAMVVGVARMYLHISSGVGLAMEAEGAKKRPGARAWLRELAATVFKESLVQYRSSRCEEGTSLLARLGSRWLTHMAIFWGFLGLLVSTALRFLVYPTNGATVPVTDPVRLLGTISGLLLSYGTLYMMVSRARKSTVSTSHTQFTDWIFLGLLFLSGASGFFLEAIAYSGPLLMTQAALAAHLVVVFELLVTAPFTKFAHVFYRPLAIWVSRAHGYVEPQ